MRVAQDGGERLAYFVGNGPDSSPSILTRERCGQLVALLRNFQLARAFFSFSLTINHALAPSVDNMTPTMKKMPMAAASLLRKAVRSARTSCFARGHAN